ncbi:MAG: M28 family metallopeptidase [Acidobacteriales bacterium]|nr:M28 family metallopeptidase [Terriglobales bacterium]
MLFRRLLSSFALLMCAGATTVAQPTPAVSTPANRKQAVQPAARPAAKDPAIAAALKNVSATQIRHSIEWLAGFGNRNTLSVVQPASSGHGIGAARDWIKAEFERYSKECGGCLEVALDTFTAPPADRIPKPTEISNVYAVLRGTDPENAKRIYVVTGHYDSRNSDTLNITDSAPGANDDASGTAVSLECARVLSKHKFPATIIFLAVAGEEQGLTGARHFAKMAKEKGWNIAGVLNNDIVGGNKTPGDRLQNFNTVRVFSEGVPAAASEQELSLLRALGGENDSESRQLARYVRETASRYVSPPFRPTLIYRRDRYLRGGDHSAFNQEGIAAVRFTEWREDYNHQHQNVRTENGIEYGDLPKFVNFEYVANVARVNAATLASLASAPAPPANVKLLTKELENNSTLVWEASPGSLATGYEVLWRETTAPDWQQSRSVPKGQTRITLPMSKDNVIFAVRARDDKGHSSVAVVPLPER